MTTYEKAIEWLKETAPEFAEEAAPLFEKHQHLWMDNRGSFVPTKEEIEETVLVLIHHLAKRQAENTGTGGITIYIKHTGEDTVQAEIHLLLKGQKQASLVKSAIFNDGKLVSQKTVIPGVGESGWGGPVDLVARPGKPIDAIGTEQPSGSSPLDEALAKCDKEIQLVHEYLEELTASMQAEIDRINKNYDLLEKEIALLDRRVAFLEKTLPTSSETAEAP